MMKIALAVLAAAAVLTAPLAIPAKAQGVKMTQVDMQTGRHLDDRDPGYYGERRGYDSNATVGVGPGGVTIDPRHRCRVGQLMLADNAAEGRAVLSARPLLAVWA